MVASSIVTLVAVALQAWFASAAVELDVNVTAITSEVESDFTAVYYSSKKPLLIGNDGDPDTGGFHVFGLDSASLSEVAARATGRTKLVTTLHGVGDRDLIATIAQPDSVIRLFEAPKITHVKAADFKALGDWSALCSWKSQAGNDYLYLFGKNQAVQLLVRETRKSVEIVEVQTFDTSFEVSGCAVSRSQSRMYLSVDDDKDVYVFPLKESTEAPEITQFGEAEDDVTGVAVYVSTKKGADYLFVAQEDKVAIYDKEFALKATLTLTGREDIEVSGLSIYQAATSRYPAGVLTYAIETDEGKGFGVTSLEDILHAAGIEANTAYSPRKEKVSSKSDPICSTCSESGYCLKNKQQKCDCFSGFAGKQCSKYTCTDDCSGRGKCVGPNVCKCSKGWGGLHCSFLLVEATYETEARPGDGDDPAIWISPVSREESRIVATMKSGDAAGLGVFDLSGNLVQAFAAGEPNNVDIIYGFEAGDRTVDLAFAACREDDTLCLFEMRSNGTLAEIAGGSHPVVDDFSVYGSCTYRSPATGKQYLFINEKSARYLQYELTSTADGELQTTLVRDFTGGSGGQVEGCVTDEENGWIFIGEEPRALWRYGAEPDAGDDGVLVAEIGDGQLYGDVEGVTLVVGPNPDEGFILVSCQGVSAYNVYRRASPHDYITTFTVTASADGQIDAVSNTDGLTAVGVALNDDFPYGLVVVHDDANQLPDGTTSNAASFKLISLEDILGSKHLGIKGLLKEIDTDWDPRK
ncbi:hypothetical protein B0J13DRAFT_439179 [Dactylonectria estremocensis]|uniref:3-phytase n=1 Tax=Dactylonectria estremocensis TaxID=1079267 RepID=A0A9P9J9D5_9HYPO|nr:hypothetical protein B0J13DRAFT_439179 [Dactylonectria estremocensis]